jgi:hypothetical protein
MPPTDNEKLLQSIDAKLDQMLRLSALQMASGMKQAQAIQILSAAGFERKLIADLLNTTPNTVSVTMAKAKARTKPRDNDAVQHEVVEG